MATVLTGADLLKRVKDMGDVGKSELVRSCGYVGIKADGGERLNFTAFYEALLAAKGIDLDKGCTSNGRGRSLSYVATVQGNGNLLVGKAYVEAAGFRPGDRFSIKFGRRQALLTFLEDVEQGEDEAADLQMEEDEARELVAV
jgi:hypothetical protein